MDMKELHMEFDGMAFSLARRGSAKRPPPWWMTGLVFVGLCVVSRPHAILAHGTIPPSLKDVQVPQVPGLLRGSGRIVLNRKQAVALGKALFWDIQVGSDGVACATCHYHAGTDARVTNELSPGHATATRPTATTYEPTASGGNGGPNYTLRRADFPFHQLADPSDPTSSVLFTTDDVVGSSGSFGGAFVSAQDDSAFDNCSRTPDPTFNVHGVGTRRITSRNAPSVINAVFSRRLFWDGRANSVFNGVNAFGNRDPDAGVWLWRHRRPEFKPLRLSNAALASQAVTPPLDTSEMSCSGRRFADVGRKLLSRRALQFQAVHPDDSVLGRHADISGYGLKHTYADLVRRAFPRRYWGAPLARTQGAFGTPAVGTPYSQMEANFALFFGVAVQLYESTLISDQAPFDSERDVQGVPVALDAQQRRGLSAFVDLHCANCHAGPTLSGAVRPQKGVLVTEVDRKPIRRASGAMTLGLVDAAFVNTGVVPVDHDAGVGGTDMFGYPLSLTKQYLAMLQGTPTAASDPFVAASCAMTVPFAVAAFGQPAFAASELIADGFAGVACGMSPWGRVPSAAVVTQELALADHGRLPDGTLGAFKVPSLRNVELTGPYMHNGGMATLEEVVAFYNRGGNFASTGKDAQFLFGVGASDETLADLVAFLKSLTDERVRWERAPFDHPSLPLPVGHVGDENSVVGDSAPGFSLLAETRYVEIPAVGSAGRDAALGPLQPLSERLSP